MLKKMLAVFTSVLAALAVVGVAWASGDDDTSTSITSATSATIDSSAGSTPLTAPDATTATTNDDSTSTSSAGTSSSSSAQTSTSQATTSTSTPGSTSVTSGSSTSTSIASTTSTSFDDSDQRVVPDGVTSHVIPGVGTVTIEVFGGDLFLASVNAPGWDVDRDKIEADRIRLRFTSGDAEAEFEARIHNGGVEVRIDVDD